MAAPILPRREEPDINTLCPQSTFQELPVMGKEYASLDRSWPPVLGSGVRHVLEESFLNFSRVQSCYAIPFPGTMKYGCRTRTLCLEQGPPRWSPPSGECSLLVPLPEPARDPPAWECPRRKAAAERHIALFYSVRDPSRHIWQQFTCCRIVY